MNNINKDGEALDYVIKIKINTNPKLEKKVRVCVDSAARFVYNACLQESLRRSKQSQRAAWARIKDIDPSIKKEDKKKYINKIWNEEDKKAQFSAYDIIAFSKIFSKSWLNKDGHILSRNVGILAERAFETVKKCRYEKTRVRFKKRGEFRLFPSTTDVRNPSLVVSEDNRFYLRWGNKNLRGKKKLNFDSINPEKYGLFPLSIDKEDDLHKAFIEDYKSNPKIVRYSEVCFDDRGDKRIYYIIIHLKNKPLQVRKTIHKQIVGIDIGPSSIATVAADGWLKKWEFRGNYQHLLFNEFERLEKEIANLNRQMQRQREANNPHLYEINDKGKKVLKKGIKLAFNRSKKYEKSKQKLKRTFRRFKELKNNIYGQIVKEILEHGNIIKIENISHIAFQKNKRFNRSVRAFSLGKFESLLAWQVKKTGGEVIKIDTYHTCLSQTCICGDKVKKNLSIRSHECSKCGLGKNFPIDRDLFSAYLAMFVGNDGKTLDRNQAQKEFERFCSSLQSSCTNEKQSRQSTDNVGCQELS